MVSLFIESPFAQQLWRRGAASQDEDRRKLFCRFCKKAAYGYAADLLPSGDWDDWLHRKEVREVCWHQRSVSLADLVVLSAMQVHLSWRRKCTMKSKLFKTLNDYFCSIFLDSANAIFSPLHFLRNAENPLGEASSNSFCVIIPLLSRYSAILINFIFSPPQRIFISSKASRCLS